MIHKIKGITVEVGQTWVRRNGQKVVISSLSDTDLPIVTDGAHYYTTNGESCLGKGNSPYDLIALRADPIVPDWREKFPVGSVWKTKDSMKTEPGDRDWSDATVIGHGAGSSPMEIEVFLGKGRDRRTLNMTERGTFGNGDDSADLIKRVDIPSKPVKAATIEAAGCNCHKEKHAFWFHASYCPLYQPASLMMQATAEVSAFMPAPDYRTEGDKRAEAERAKRA